MSLIVTRSDFKNYCWRSLGIRGLKNEECCRKRSSVTVVMIE